MTDIVERLENHNREALLGQTIYRDATREIEALRAENARLREALKPILPDKVLDEEEYSLVCNFHLNAALMAYGEIHD